jgi:putative hydrolase of the HAD superfamily
VKPQAEIYRDAIGGLRIDAAQAVFLDDRQDNVDGSRAAGLRGELYTTWEDLIAAGLPARYALPVPAMEDVARRQ